MFTFIPTGLKICFKEALEILNMLFLASFARCKMYVLAQSHLDDENLLIYVYLVFLCKNTPCRCRELWNPQKLAEGMGSWREHSRLAQAM